MYPSFTRLLKLEHYGRSKFLRFVSAIQFIFSLLLALLPFYLKNLLNILIFKPGTIPNGTNIACNIIAWPIAIVSIINIYREYLLSRTNIVNIDFNKKIIRTLIVLLTDTYGWRGTCRATLFVPCKPKEDKIVIYDRISTGREPGYQGDAFFRMGQGMPGMAWKNAWSGEDRRALVESIVIGNAPNNILKNEKELRKFFKDNFYIQDDDIYDSLGEGKFDIKSYMAVGILGKYNRLICVLIIDSEDENKFADFERIQKVQTGTLHHELSIVGRSSQDEEKTKTVKGEPEKNNKLNDIIKFNEILQKDIGLDETMKRIKGINFAFHAEHVQSIRPNIEGFINPLNWVLKQIKDILIEDI